MKAERRHELQHNQLAAWMATNYSKIKPWIGAIGLGIVVVVIVWVAYTLLSDRAAEQEATLWENYHAALRTSSEQNQWSGLKNFIDANESGPTVLLARQRLGQAQLFAAARKQLSDIEAANALYADAISNLIVVRNSTEDKLLQAHTTYQIARARESSYDLEGARTEYRKIVDEWPQSAEAAEAKERLDDLARKSTKEYYDWHRTAKVSILPPAFPFGPPATKLPGEDLTNVPDAPAPVATEP